MKRQPSPEKECPVCGQKCASRGLKSHLRLKHGIKLIEQVVDVPDRQQVKEIVQEVLARITPAAAVTLTSNLHTGPSDQPPMPVQTVEAVESEGSPALQEWREKLRRWCVIVSKSAKEDGMESTMYKSLSEGLMRFMYTEPSE